MDPKRVQFSPVAEREESLDRPSEERLLNNGAAAIETQQDTARLVGGPGDQHLEDTAQLKGISGQIHQHLADLKPARSDLSRPKGDHDQQLRQWEELVVECEKRLQRYVSDMTYRHDEIIIGLASLHSHLFGSFLLPTALSNECKFSDDAGQGSVVDVDMESARIINGPIVNGDGAPAKVAANYPMHNGLAEPLHTRFHQEVAHARQAPLTLGFAASELQASVALQLAHTTERLESVAASVEKSHRAEVARGEPVDTHNTLAQVILETPPTDNFDYQDMRSSLISATAATELPAKLDRMKDVIAWCSSDITDLRVQVRSLSESVKSAESRITGLMEVLPSQGGQWHETRQHSGKGTDSSTVGFSTGTPFTPFSGPAKLASAATHDIFGRLEFLNPDPATSETAQRGNLGGEAAALMTVLKTYDVKHLMYAQNSWAPDEPERTSQLAQILNSQDCERLVSAMIVLNVFFLAYSADYAVQNPFDQANLFITVGEAVFLVFYCAELTLRLKVHSMYFFINDEAPWNLLDFFLVVVSMWDLMVTHLLADGFQMGNVGSEGGFNVSFLRTLRLFRMSKIFRILRVMRYFNELRMLMNCITMSFRPLFWCMLNMFIFFAIFAITFLHGVAGYLQDPASDPVKKAALVRDWGSIGDTFLSLYKVTTGGADWGGLADSLRVTGDLYFVLFLIFTAFILLAVLNIMTGIFVDRAIRVSSEDRDGLILEKLHNERVMVEDLTRTFFIISGLDVYDSGGEMTKAQFVRSMGMCHMRTRFAVAGLEIWDAAHFFNLLTHMSVDGRVDVQTFVTGCMQLRSDPKGIAVQGILSDIHCLANEVMGMREQVNQIHGLSVRSQSYRN